MELLNFTLWLVLAVLCIAAPVLIIVFVPTISGFFVGLIAVGAIVGTLKCFALMDAEQ